MDLLVVVPAEPLLLFVTPAAQRLLDVTGRVLAADHEADLAARVGRDGRVGVLSGGEDLLAGLLEISDQGEVDPLVFSYEG